ncbi:hypothetical protein [Desulfobulbus elongatus]|uniref:hypothetical protein n=1 Tax=Desulfobulbus elongatus TaxID=53332 RepID=UPI0012FC4A60|nr:hypothetical protein [Desulfobulbus elongatus]
MAGKLRAIYLWIITYTEDNLSSNIWQKYKSVSHLWATLPRFFYKENFATRSNVFVNIAELTSIDPRVQAEGIQGFLAISKKILTLASNFIPHRAQKPILDIDEAINLDNPLNLIKTNN